MKDIYTVDSKYQITKKLYDIKCEKLKVKTQQSIIDNTNNIYGKSIKYQIQIKSIHVQIMNIDNEINNK